MISKRIVIASVSIVLLGAWTFGVIRLNATSEQPQKQVYQVGDHVDYGDNYFDFSSEIIDGYSLEVLSAKVYEYDTYKKVMEIKTSSSSEWHSDYVLDVEIRFFNKGGSEGKGGIPFIYTYLASADNRLAVNTKLVGAMYPQLGDDPIGFSIRPGTDMILHIPFQIEMVPALYVGDEKKYLETTDFYLNVTQYPVKQLVLLRDGSTAA